MHQSRGLQGVIGSLFSDVVVGYSTEFFVDERYEAAQRFPITVAVLSK